MKDFYNADKNMTEEELKALYDRDMEIQDRMDMGYESGKLDKEKDPNKEKVHETSMF